MNMMFRHHPQPSFNFNELVVDNFAGGGGASTGIERAIGRSVDIAINHDIDAIRMHETNHPHTKHYCESVWDVDPVTATNGQPVGLAWFSPDCKHFSKAKGGKPVEKKIRGLAWVMLRWIAKVRPRIIMLENVEEFTTWGPLDHETGKPCPKNIGREFKSFINAIKRHGYSIDHRELAACDYGAPTTRKRLFLIARCDGLPIVWPKPTHGNPTSHQVKSGELKPWRTAAEIIDWSIPCPSIFNRKKPLVENTLKRIAKGLEKFVFNNSEPFVITGPDKNTLATPFITEHANASNQRNMRLNEPLRTICAQVKGGHFAVVAPIIDRQFSNGKCMPANTPLGTIMAQGGGGKSALVQAFLLKYYGTSTAQACTAPLDTITTKDRFGLITVKGTQYRLVDIGMRMLKPSELFAAQGFPDDYIIDHDHTGKKFTNTQQVARCGNSVCPDLASALVEANYINQHSLQEAA